MIYLYNRKDYSIKYNDRLIYDIGMHSGKDTEFYLKKGFKVVSVEANNTLVNKAKVKYKKFIDRGELVIIDKAISTISGEKIPFYIDKNKDDWGSLYNSWNDHINKMVAQIFVEAITLDETLLKHDIPYYMKIDIEGADIICLNALINFEIKPKYISAELMTPDNMKSINSCLDILSTLKVLGYTKFKLSDQSLNHDIVCPKPPREGQFVDYAFDGESSGLFGKELPGEWIDYDHLVYNYLKYFHEYEDRIRSYLIRKSNKFLKTKFKENQYFSRYHWYDVHATFDS